MDTFKTIAQKTEKVKETVYSRDQRGAIEYWSCDVIKIYFWNFKKISSFSERASKIMP